MSDLLERLAADNPVPGCDPPPIGDVWRKLAELETESRAVPTRRRVAIRAGRAVPALAAVAVPLIVVIAIAIPVLGGHHRATRPVGRGSPDRSALDPAAQRVAEQQLAGRAGAIVAIDPRTGAIRAVYGNAAPSAGGTGTAAAASSPLAIAAEAEYPPGATFDVVSATAALDAGRYTPQSRITGRSPLAVLGVPLKNDANQSFGPITLAEALDYSVNTVFAQVGEAVGRGTMSTYMRRFGFYLGSPLSSSLAGLPGVSGVVIDGGVVLPTDPRVDLGRLAIGQGGLAVSPLQMAMVASAVADDGELVVPHLALSASVREHRVMKPATAHTLALMLRDVVRQGTGTPADREGLQVAGKTGTAQVGGARSGRADAWFIGFAPANHPTIAIAVVLKNVRGGYGGIDAAPIAAKVIQALLATHR